MAVVWETNLGGVARVGTKTAVGESADLVIYVLRKSNGYTKMLAKEVLRGD